LSAFFQVPLLVHDLDSAERHKQLWNVSRVRYTRVAG